MTRFWNLLVPCRALQWGRLTMAWPMEVTITVDIEPLRQALSDTADALARLTKLPNGTTTYRPPIEQISRSAFVAKHGMSDPGPTEGQQ